MKFGEDNLDPKPANEALSQEELIREWKSMDAEADYKVPDVIVAEVQEYLNKLKNHDLTKEEFMAITSEMREKEEKDLNYKLARLELTVSKESQENKYDPLGSKHMIHELRRKLAGNI
jgi:ribosomal protein L29